MRMKKENCKSKGISTFVAAILLIAFTVSVGGVVSVWFTTFSRTSTETISQEASTQIACSYAGVTLSNLRFSSPYLSGRVRNSGTISLGNLTLYVLFSNSSQQKFNLCLAGGLVANCSDTYNLTMSPSDIYSFNFTSNSNYDKIRITTNCSAVYDEATSGDVTIG